MMLKLYTIPFLAKLLLANGYPISPDELLDKMCTDMFLDDHYRPIQIWCDAGMLVPGDDCVLITDKGLKRSYGYYGPDKEINDKAMCEAFNKLVVCGEMYTMRCCAGVIEYY